MSWASWCVLRPWLYWECHLTLLLNQSNVKWSIHCLHLWFSFFFFFFFFWLLFDFFGFVLLMIVFACPELLCVFTRTIKLSSATESDGDCCCFLWSCAVLQICSAACGLFAPLLLPLLQRSFWCCCVHGASQIQLRILPACVHLYFNLWQFILSPCLVCVCVCVRACMRICVHMCVHLYLCQLIWSPSLVYVYVCVRVCMHACVHVCVWMCFSCGSWVHLSLLLLFDVCCILPLVFLFLLLGIADSEIWSPPSCYWRSAKKKSEYWAPQSS